MTIGVLDINNIRANLALGGIRPTLFQVVLTNPIDSSADAVSPFRILATGLPSYQMGTIQVPYMGRYIKNPGDRRYDSWSVTVLDDQDWAVRNSLERWNAQMNSLQGNARIADSAAPLLMKSSGTINMLTQTGDILRTYTVEGIWPKTVGSMQLSWGLLDQVATFDTTFELDWFEPTFTGSLTPPVV